MSFYDGLLPALWLAWGGYWLIAARGNKAVRRRESVWSRLSHFGPLVIAGSLLVPTTLPNGILCGRFLPRGLPTFWTGVAIVLLGLGFAVWARRSLGGNWSGTVTLKHDHELVRGGPYRFVRHPIYTGLLGGFLGSAIALGQWRGLLALLIVLVAFWHKARIEERWMQEIFGDAYRRYRGEVPMLIPLPRLS